MIFNDDKGTVIFEVSKLEIMLMRSKDILKQGNLYISDHKKGF